MTSTTQVARAVGHYLEQPPVVQRARKYALGAGTLASGAIIARNALQVETAEKRRKSVVRNLIVIGFTALGTILAARKWLLPKGTRLAGQAIKSLKSLVRLARNGKLPVPKVAEESILQELFKFTAVGGASVVSGFLGGLLANRINGDASDRFISDRTGSMAKEAMYQFIANIVMGTVGAGAGVKLARTVPAIQKSAPARLGVIGLGLGLGIYIGGVLTNAMTRRLFPAKQGAEQTNRKIEVADALLHLDDLALALVFAGVEILTPFVPIFFAFSGYRAGMGYQYEKSAEEEVKTPIVGGLVSPYPSLIRRGSVFMAFHGHRPVRRAPR